MLGDLGPAVSQLPVVLAEDVLFLLGPLTLPDGGICSQWSSSSSSRSASIHHIMHRDNTDKRPNAKHK